MFTALNTFPLPNFYYLERKCIIKAFQKCLHKHYLSTQKFTKTVVLAITVSTTVTIDMVNDTRRSVSKHASSDCISMLLQKSLYADILSSWCNLLKHR